MATGFYITEKGRNLIAQAAADETKVVITKLKVGDGATIHDAPNPELTDLKNTVFEKDFDPDYDRYFIDKNTPNVIRIQCTLPNDVGDFDINEAGYYDENDNLILYGVMQNTPKHAGAPATLWTVKFENIITFRNATDLEHIEFKIELGNLAELEQAIEDVQRQLVEMVIYACDSNDIRDIVGDISLPYEEYKPDYADREDIDDMFENLQGV